MWRPVATGASLGLGHEKSLEWVAGELVAQLLDFHHQVSVALPFGVDLTMFPGITATSVVVLGDFVGVALEVLHLLSLVHLAARVIMAVNTILPVADVSPTLFVWPAVLLSVVTERQRRCTPAARLLPLAGCIHLAGGLHAIHLRNCGIHCLHPNLRVWTLRFTSASIGCAATTLRLVRFGTGGRLGDVRIRLPDIPRLPVLLASSIPMLRLPTVL